MKKTILTLISLCLLMVCLVFTVSCSDSLDEVKNFKLDPDTLTLSWDLVINARSYSVQVEGQDFEKTSKQNKYSLEYLEPGTYEIKVKANGDGVEIKDSDWVSYTFVREAEDGMRYKLINNKTEYELVSLGTASGDIVMSDTYRGKPITSIADKAFAGNSRITSFVVGKNVKTIGDSAFTRCAELTSITIPDNVTSIGKSCFQSCKKLESFVFPSSITTVPDYMFSWCSALKSVTFSSKTETISQYAFSNCKALEKVTLPDTLTVVGEYAFSDCESLTEADLGSSLKTIQPYAFYNCIVMDTIHLGSSLELIDEYAFGNCDGLVSMEVPESVTTIGYCAFRYCDNLAEVSFLGQALEYIGSGAFYNTKIYNDAKDSLVIDGWYINCKNKEITDVRLPAGVYGIADSAFYTCKKIVNVNISGVKYVCNYAFYGCEELLYVTFDSALTSIGSYAFKDCKKLMKANFGNSLYSIGDYAFSNCSKLQDKNVTLPASLRVIGSGAFKGTTATIEKGIMYIGNWAVGMNLGPGSAIDKLEIRNGTIGIANYAFNKAPILQSDMNGYGIKIPDTVKYIGRGAFYQAAASGYVVTVYLSKKVETIGDYAFYGNYCAFFGQNRELIIPEGVEYIGRSAFYGCENIYALSIAGTVKEIGPYAFYGCVNLGADFDDEDEKTPTVEGYFLLGEGIEVIGDKAFYSCSGIQSITLPDSLTKLGSRAFYKCSGLTELTLGAGLTEIPDYAFYNCTSLTSLSIPESITSIGKYAFKGCESLQTLTLPGTVSSIGSFAFMGAENLSTLTIPESVKSIGMHAFRGMTNAKSIFLPASVTTIDAHAFYGALNVSRDTTAVIYIYGTPSNGEWNVRYNSSYVPVVTGCTLSSDKTYLVCFVKGDGNPDNMPTDGSMTPPVRDGYTFVGFSTENNGGVVYTMANLKSAPVGTVLFTVWAPEVTPNN